ncbi:MAG: RtcB family protein, partial [Fulvivirga sp.]
MATIKLTGKELRAIGYPEGRIIATVMNVMEEEYKGKSKKFKLELLSRVLASPALYVKHEQLGPIAKGLIIKKEQGKYIELNKHRKEYNVYGLEGI